MFACSAIVLRSLMLCRVAESAGAPGPRSQLGWSCPRPGTMDACALSICVALSDFLPNKDHLALSLLSVSSSSQKSKAQPDRAVPPGVQVHSPAMAQRPWASHPARGHPWSGFIAEGVPSHRGTPSADAGPIPEVGTFENSASPVTL